MTFHAIVHEGSITKAAQKLELAAPSVSNSLKSLEGQLGLPLFTRTTRRIELTQAGRALYEQTLGSLSDLNLALENIKDLSRVPSGQVRITMPRFVFQTLFKPHYAEFCRLYPEIELEISISDAAIDILQQGFDLGIRFGDRVEEGMVARALTPTMKEAFFATPEYIAEYGKPSRPEQLKHHKLVQYRFITSNKLVPVLLDNQGETIEVSMPNAIIVNDTELMLDATLKGLGIGRMVQPVVKDLLNNGQLIPILEPYWYPYSAVYVYFHKHTQKAKRVRVLIDFLVEKLAC